MDRSEVNSGQRANDLIKLGADVFGGVLGGAMGALAADPISGAAAGLAGTALSATLFHIATEFQDRRLSARQKARIGAGFGHAVLKIQEHLNSGSQPRKDGFFIPDESSRSDAEEILEGVLLRCKNEHEERKLKYIGNIYANVAFMPEVDIANANWLLQTARRLTYRQLCIISLIERKDNRSFSKTPSWGPKDGDPGFEREFKDLKSSFLAVDPNRPGAEVGRDFVFGLNRSGKFLYALMSMNEIPEEDLRELAPRFPWAFKSS